MNENAKISNSLLEICIEKYKDIKFNNTIAFCVVWDYTPPMEKENYHRLKHWRFEAEAYYKVYDMEKSIVAIFAVETMFSKN